MTDRQSTDILRLLAANVTTLSFRSTSALRRLTTTWSLLSTAATLQATTSSKLMRSTRESSLQQESSPLSPTSQMSSLSVLKNTDRELSISSDNTPDALPAPLQDGSPELWPIRSLKNSRNPDSLLLLIPRATTRPSSRHPMSTFPPLLFATLMLLLSTLMSLFLATTEFPNPSPLSSGCSLEKWWFWEELWRLTKNGLSWSICSLLVTLKPLEKSKTELNKRRRRLISNKEANWRLRRRSKVVLLRWKMRLGDDYGIYHLIELLSILKQSFTNHYSAF